MNQLNFNNHSQEAPPPAGNFSNNNLPVVQKAIAAYLLWHDYYKILPKTHKHSLGQKIDIIFSELIESLASAGFLPREEKQPYVRLAIRKTDTLKIFLMILWETKSLDNNKYAALSIKVSEIGKMLGGWYGQLKKQNSPNK